MVTLSWDQQHQEVIKTPRPEGLMEEKMTRTLRAIAIAIGKNPIN